MCGARPGGVRPGGTAQQVGRDAEEDGRDQRGGPGREYEGEREAHRERDGGARVQGGGAGRGVQRGLAALPAGLFTQFVAHGLACHLRQFVDQLPVQVFQVIHAFHALRVPAGTASMAGPPHAVAAPN